MNTGKTARLMMHAYSIEDNGGKVVIAKSIKDKKADNFIESRPLGRREVDIMAEPEMDLYDIMRRKYPTADSILVDEAQFLVPEQVDQLRELVDDRNIQVTCYGLRTDFRRHLFPGSMRLFELADVLEELNKDVQCICHEKASFVVRMEDGIDTFDGESIAIDGEKSEDNKVTSYDTVCPKCYRKRFFDYQVKILSK